MTRSGKESKQKLRSTSHQHGPFYMVSYYRNPKTRIINCERATSLCAMKHPAKAASASERGGVGQFFCLYPHKIKRKKNRTRASASVSEQAHIFEESSSVSRARPSHTNPTRASDHTALATYLRLQLLLGRPPAFLWAVHGGKRVVPVGAVSVVLAAPGGAALCGGESVPILRDLAARNGAGTVRYATACKVKIRRGTLRSVMVGRLFGRGFPGVKRSIHSMRQDREPWARKGDSRSCRYRQPEGERHNDSFCVKVVQVVRRWDLPTCRRPA